MTAVTRNSSRATLDMCNRSVDSYQLNIKTKPDILHLVHGLLNYFIGTAFKFEDINNIKISRFGRVNKLHTSVSVLVQNVLSVLFGTFKTFW